MKWAALFHDMQKRQTETFEGRDHTHPFVSAMMMLKILKRIGIMQSELCKLKGPNAKIDEDKF